MHFQSVPPRLVQPCNYYYFLTHRHLLKRVRGGLSFVWFVDVLQGFVFAPWIAWVIWSERPRLGWGEWACVVGSAIIHIAYYLFLRRGYRLGDISLVYPIARGSGPMLSSIVAILFLGERPGILGYSWNHRNRRWDILFDWRSTAQHASEYESCMHRRFIHLRVHCDLHIMG